MLWRREQIEAAAPYLRARFDYDPESGVLTWRVRPVAHFASPAAAKRWNTRVAGAVAGSPHVKGYRKIQIGSRLYLVHRIAWALATGADPGGSQIDHLN